ncbi:hypothetical protein B296_00008290 [Ensete ventricosum]|uniref:Uncharacterized protein n=1 Tax=Ensete ventricosum TaxID=4639 RepID=A0A427AKF2_ENSVE|nr:hypothetical protein B296_00008290 [Ensete ventricosum]
MTQKATSHTSGDDLAHVTLPSHRQPFSLINNLVVFGLGTVTKSAIHRYMGSCFSSASAAETPSPVTAKVITLDGSLSEYFTEVTVYEVLGRHHPSRFICSSDELYCNTYIPALGSQESLQLGQLYFMLPVSKLEYPLSGSDMAALAVKASLALRSLASRHRGHGRRTVQVMPIAAEFAGLDALDNNGDDYRSRSLERKKTMTKRSASNRAKFGQRRRGMERMSTIEEDA